MSSRTSRSPRAWASRATFANGSTCCASQIDHHLHYFRTCDPTLRVCLTWYGQQVRRDFAVQKRGLEGSFSGGPRRVTQRCSGLGPPGEGSSPAAAAGHVTPEAVAKIFKPGESWRGSLQARYRLRSRGTLPAGSGTRNPQTLEPSQNLTRAARLSHRSAMKRSLNRPGRCTKSVRIAGSAPTVSCSRA